MGQNNQEYRLEYWATCSSICSFPYTTHLFVCSALLISFVRSAALTCLLNRSLFMLFKEKYSLYSLKNELNGSRFSQNLVYTTGSSYNNSPQNSNSCSLSVPTLCFIHYQFIFFSSNLPSSIKRWTKWVPILIKLGAHHGLFLPQLFTKFQLLLSLRS